MFTYRILSTIEVSDHTDKIEPGHSLYNVDDPDLFETEDEAVRAGQAVLAGLDGGKAYNLALESAEVVAVDA